MTTRFEKACASVRNLAYDDSETTQEDFKVEKDAVLENLRDLNQRTIAPIDRAYVDLIDCVADSVTRRANVEKRRACVDRELEKLQRALEKVAATADRDAKLLALIRNGSTERVHRAFIVDDDAPIEIVDDDDDDGDDDDDDDEESSDVCDDVYDNVYDDDENDEDDEDTSDDGVDVFDADEGDSPDESESSVKRQRTH